MAGVGKNLFSPLLLLNFVLYVVVVGFASWGLDHLIDGGVGGNGATFYFIMFSILAGVIGVVSKFAGGNHLRASRNESIGPAISTAIIAWAVTGLASKEINLGGHRGWRLKTLEAFIIILTFTQLLYILVLHV